MVFSLSAKQHLRILEVGSWIGGSALTFAAAVARFCPSGADIFCVDFWEPAEIHRETGFDTAIFDDDLPYRAFRHNAGFAASRINVIRGETATCLAALKPASFDIVYVDASHYYRDVRDDLAQGKGLVADAGFLAGDDYELSVADVGVDLCRKFIELDHAMAPQGEFHPGVTLAVHEVIGDVPPGHGGCFATRKRATSFVPYDFDLDQFRPFVPPHFTPSAQQAFADYTEANGFRPERL